MSEFKVNTAFYPIRLNAYTRNEVEMNVQVENVGKEPRWTECDVLLPDTISLAPDRDLAKGRLRIGIIKPNEILTKKCKIYAGAKSYPDTYQVKLVVYGYGKDGAISVREEKTVPLRCESLGRF